jgi:hypothetical protein
MQLAGRFHTPLLAKGYGDSAARPGALDFAGEIPGAKANHHGSSRWPKKRPRTL